MTPVLRYRVSLFTFPCEKWTTQGCIRVPKHQTTGIKADETFVQGQMQACYLSSDADLLPKLHTHTVCRHRQTADYKADNHTRTTPAHQFRPAAGANRRIWWWCCCHDLPHDCCAPFATQALNLKPCGSPSCLHRSGNPPLLVNPLSLRCPLPAH